MELRDKVAVLAGGTRIGHTVALKLAEAGVDVALTSRRFLESAAIPIGKGGEKAV